MCWALAQVGDTLLIPGHKQQKDSALPWLFPLLGETKEMRDLQMVRWSVLQGELEDLTHLKEVS